MLNFITNILTIGFSDNNKEIRAAVNMIDIEDFKGNRLN